MRCTHSNVTAYLQLESRSDVIVAKVAIQIEAVLRKTAMSPVAPNIRQIHHPLDGWMDGWMVM